MQALYLKFKICIFTSLLLICISCSKQLQTRTDYQFDPISLGAEHAGSQRVKVWGEGYSKSGAIQEAKKNAIYFILFEGIRKGKHEIYPLVPETNAEKKYAAYFNNLFSNSRNYSMFVEEKIKEKEVINPEHKLQVQTLEQKRKQIRVAIELTVKVEALRNDLIQNNIIK